MNDKAVPAAARRARVHRPRGEAGPAQVPALGKGLDVVELLASSPDGLAMNEIADRLGRTMGEIYRIVLYLADRGYVQQDVAGRYGLTLRLFELSHRFEPTERLISLALPLMESLSRRAEQSCHLAVLNGDSILVLASVPSPRPAGYSVRTGAIFPALATSSGVVIAAFLPQDRLDLLVNPAPSNEAASFIARVAAARRLGFETIESVLVNGVINSSVPVFGRGGILAALSMGYVNQAGDSMPLKDAIEAIRDTAARISAAMGSSLAPNPG
ncbi:MULTISPECIES: IclR family transcriptional regulator [Sphingomonas]|jgi:DNA-binding IclR family transcriptional regulator|uniref:IclR family transcriptional regulator n=1 Tax=Sphingomonas TaxID=13687 RepID=UPI0009A19CE7|nr:IclR family transcriptional regulator [Sphingomonas turrisvirgatae]